MKPKPKQYLIFIFILILNLTFCQDNKVGHQIFIGIPEVALISVQNVNSQIILQGTNITKAGKKIKFNAIDKSTWINYSSIVGSTDELTRYVTIEISEGKIPDGLKLFVRAFADVGMGGGNLGIPINSKQVLENIPVKIIENIGSCYTGVGVNNGHNILYKLKLSDEDDAYSKLDFNQSQTLALTYTLSDY